MLSTHQKRTFVLQANGRTRRDEASDDCGVASVGGEHERRVAAVVPSVQRCTSDEHPDDVHVA